MISLCSVLPSIKSENAELVKIKCLFDSYKNDDKVLFWSQDNDKCLISFTDGNMIIFNNGANIEELYEFVNIISPVSIYSDYETLCRLNKKPREKINVMSRFADIKGEAESEQLSSKEIYELLNVDGLSLPEYPYFAVDFCHRLNRGFAKYFAISQKCAIITFNTEDYAIINGLASHQSGMGSIALKNALMQNYGKTLLVCCRDKVKGFYEKNGFKPLYFSGYWVKNDGYN